ncbi:MAG: hypothetical protein ACXWRE_01640 [Pseudobdellovibrionaceae bacterium]
MRNILLALTSFLVTVLILSKVALAGEEPKDWDPNHTFAADENSSSKDPVSSSISDTDAGVPDAGNKCPSRTCYKRSLAGRREKVKTKVTKPSNEDTSKPDSDQGQDQSNKGHN